jgi:hypothetical protein
MKPAVATALALSLAGCLEIEETVEVRADGSARVTVSAEGDAPDLTDGFPVPTWGPWRAADDATLAWLAGEPLAQDAEGVSVTADFASIADLPASWAPPPEPYRSAYLQRTTDLQVLSKGARTVYVFTRSIGARRYADWSASARIDAGLEDDLREALEAQRELTPQQWSRAVALVRGAYRDAARALVSSALAGVFTRGDAGLSLEAHARVLARVEEAVVATITEPRLRSLYVLLCSPAARQEQAPQEVPPDLDLDRLTREATRGALALGLEQAGLSQGVRNAVFEGLEWSFTALDQTRDLDDERLTLRLRLPGRIVAGNFAALDEDGTAVFRLEAADLHDRAVTWHAVSVLE